MVMTMTQIRSLWFRQQAKIPETSTPKTTGEPRNLKASIAFTEHADNYRLRCCPNGYDYLNIMLVRNLSIRVIKWNVSSSQLETEVYLSNY
jgi:hypothetical protein